MQDFAIGLSGLNAAQAALEVVGNNVANAATDGYHRQQIELTPVACGAIGRRRRRDGRHAAWWTRSSRAKSCGNSPGRARFPRSFRC